MPPGPTDEHLVLISSMESLDYWSRIKRTTVKFCVNLLRIGNGRCLLQCVSLELAHFTMSARSITTAAFEAA